MEMKPETFSLGVIDFFSVMLPGAAMVCVLMNKVEPHLRRLFPEYGELGEVAKWAAFLFASYLLGHYIFLLGAQLDGPIYDRLRRATPFGQGRLSPGKKPAWAFTRWLASRLFRSDPDLAIGEVLKIKAQSFPDENGKQVVNAFQWAKARLTAQSPLGLLEVQRLEADSKFFRSLVVVLFFLALWFGFFPPLLSDGRTPAEPRLVLVSICVVLGFLSLWCYVDRRFKATQHAYWFLLTLDRLPRARQGEGG